MCVIVHKSKSKKFSDKDFVACWKRNSDGLGFVSTSPIFNFQKGIMELKEALEITRPFREKGSESVFHFRIKSTGEVCADQTHPFQCNYIKTPELKRLLFHNGTIHEFSPNNQSDSQMVADIISRLSTKDITQLITNIGGWSRFILIEETVKNNFKIYHLGCAVEAVTINGIWYSNTRHHCGKIRKGGD